MHKQEENQEITFHVWCNMIAQKFADKFQVPAHTVLVVCDMDQGLYVSAAGRVWWNGDYQEQSSYLRTFHNVSDLDEKDTFGVEWTRDERRFLDYISQFDPDKPSVFGDE